MRTTYSGEFRFNPRVVRSLQNREWNKVHVVQKMKEGQDIRNV